MSNKKRFEQSRPFLTLGIVVLVWLLLPSAIKRAARTSFFEFQAPFEVAASHVRDLQDFWSLKTRSKNELIAAGRELAQLNASYEYRLRRDSDLQGEIARLEKLLQLPGEPGFRHEPARVVGRDFAQWWSRITIRKGRIHGIKKGSPVVYSGGLVGRVCKVHAYTSTVELITSPDIRIAAMIEGDTRPLSYQGSASEPGFGTVQNGVAEYVPADVSDGKPLRLVTSGLGGVYPKNITIGRLVRLDPSPDGLFKTGEVRLDPALAGLSEVTVLVPHTGD